jgi:uncharacterized SAM-binding protein YcdF (DUF218 family)
MSQSVQAPARSRRRSIAWIAVVVLTVVAATYALSPTLLTAAGSRLVYSDPLEPADAIVVLAPSMDRVMEAAELYGQGYAPLVVVTRASRDVGEQELIDRGMLQSAEDRRRDVLIGLGVPRTSIVQLDQLADSTAEEARWFAEWASRHPIRRAIVVTSPPHTYRSRQTFIRAVENLELEIRVHPSSRHPFHSDSWWRSRRTLRDGLSEWQKLIYYWLVELPRMTPVAAKPTPAKAQ